MAQNVEKGGGKLILICFIAFFALIVVVNSIFIYVALNTHSGVVISQPYEKGLAYNEILKKAELQPDIEHKVSYEDGVLRWVLPIENADVTASMVRIVQDGRDFDVTLRHIGSGVYEAKPVMPLPGAWTARLSATWGDKKFQASYDLIAQ